LRTAESPHVQNRPQRAPIVGLAFLYLEPESGLVVALLANMFCTIDEKDAQALAALYR
jgi:hypothetical protein